MAGAFSSPTWPGPNRQFHGVFWPPSIFLDNRRSVKSLTHLSRFPSLTSGSSTCRQEAKMAQELGIILAMAVIVVAIMTWAAPPNPKSASAESIQRSEVIYRPQHLKLY